jgi:hypothetical protein
MLYVKKIHGKAVNNCNCNTVTVTTRNKSFIEFLFRFELTSRFLVRFELKIIIKTDHLAQ